MEWQFCCVSGLLAATKDTIVGHRMMQVQLEYIGYNSSEIDPLPTQLKEYPHYGNFYTQVVLKLLRL